MGNSFTKINDTYILSVTASVIAIFVATIIVFFKNNNQKVKIQLDKDSKLVVNNNDQNKIDNSGSNNNQGTDISNGIKLDSLIDSNSTSSSSSSNINTSSNSISSSSSDIIEYDDYDIVIDFPSVDQFIFKGASWTIFVCNSLREAYLNNLKIKDQIQYPLHELLEGSHKFKTACVVGYFNRGKTFVINLINQCKLPSGRRTKTKGLSIIISQKNSTLFIDTQGCNTPLACNNDDIEIEERLKEIYNIKQSDLNNVQLARKKATELFHQQVAITLSNVVILVVNEMTWSDQQNIMGLQRQIMNQNEIIKDGEDIKDIVKTKMLYVVHNYMTVTCVEDLMAMVKIYVTTPFKGQFQSFDHPDTPIFYYNDAKNRTTHFFICNNNSEFGAKWNSVVASVIRSNITSIQNENPEFDRLLLKTVHESMKVNIKNPGPLKIIPYENSVTTLAKNCEKPNNHFVYQREKTDIKKESLYLKSLKQFEELYDKVGYNEVNISQTALLSIVQIESNKDPKHSALRDKDVDFVDNQVVFSGRFNPCFDRLEIGNQLILTFDMPYLKKEEIKHFISYDKLEDKKYLRVMGTRILKYKTKESNVTSGGEFGISEYPDEGVKPTSNPRKHGEFDIKIPIQACYSREYSLDFDNGMLTLVFEKTIFDNNIVPDL